MAKATFYFSHDYNARNDDKIKRLIRSHGMEGYGVFWAIIEDLYQNANAMQLDCKGIAYDLRTTEDLVKSIIFDFDLFVVDPGNGDKFSSLSIQKRMEEREERSAKMSGNARKRWEVMQKQSNDDAIALQTGCNGNALKERKGKENKGKEIKIKENKEEDTRVTAPGLFQIEIPISVEKWMQWKRFLKTEKKKNYKSAETEQIAINGLMKKAGGSATIAEAIIDQSIENNWTGLFELKNKKSNEINPRTVTTRPNPTIKSASDFGAF